MEVGPGLPSGGKEESDDGWHPRKLVAIAAVVIKLRTDAGIFMIENSVDSAT